MTTRTTGPRSGAGKLTQRLLRVPLFYKILIANAAIVLATTVGTTLVTRAMMRTTGEFQTGWLLSLAAISLLLTLLVNALILRVALNPLKLLEGTASEVQAGNLDARVPYSAVRDPELERLTGIFNGMLDTLASYRQRLSGVAVRALNAEEQERKRIARELHDDTAQSLAALLIRLRILRGMEDQEAREAMIDQFREEIGDALERIRRFARGLRPPALEELGLVPAIESHVRSTSETVGISIRVDAEPIEDLLSPSAELALYRIAQEAISNAVRHAEPASVVVRIKRRPMSVELTVTDDGKGFREEDANTGDDAGLGLFGMKERASYFGGHVVIVSGRGKGTQVRAVLPTSTDHDTASLYGGATPSGNRKSER